MSARERAAGVRQVGRAVRAEPVRVGGARSVLLVGAVPGTVLLPLLVTFGVAVVAERFASIPGSIRVTSVATTNSVYWVITFTVTGWAVIAAYAQAGAGRGALADLDRLLYPRSWIGPVARWIGYGAAAAACSALLVVAVMLLLPALFPQVYGGVAVASAAGLRFVVTVPIYAFFATGLGIGVAALVGHPAGAVVVLLGWAYVIEDAISLLPDGYTLQTYMPVLNGIYGTGQELAFAPPWGPTGALAYCGAVAAVVFGAGCLALHRRGLRR